MQIKLQGEGEYTDIYFCNQILMHELAEFREANFFLVKIFCSLNRVSDSVNDADSNDTKILTWFPGSSILEISIKIYICVGSAKMRGRFFMKVYIIAI